ncbi:MAG TPA: 30S ribosomal protein S9 [Planctomycetota bacterium]|nr:30S ribosomal protein S9 [Planctomycetota bacterium]
MAEQTQEAPQVQEPAEKPVIYWGLGRRKTAVARVRLLRGTGKFIVNGTEAEEYFTDERYIQAVRSPLKELKLANRYDVLVNAKGGGIGGQSGAVLLGLARALVKAEPDSESKLRDLGMLTRDSRMKERKKYGKKSARASFQFSKR